MEIYRLGIKIFLADPASIVLKDFVPVFHGWIQKQIVKDHLLIDVHDYSHIQGGPGILLVGHEANFSMDAAEGRLGLFYYRKQPVNGAAGATLDAILKSMFEGGRLLEDEPHFNGALRFRTDEMMIVANDRLNAPNDEKTFVEFRTIVAAGMKKLPGGGSLTLTHANKDPRERLGIRVQFEKPAKRLFSE